MSGADDRGRMTASWWQGLTPEQSEALLARAGGADLAELVRADQQVTDELRAGNQDESLPIAARDAYIYGLDAREELVRLHLHREEVVARIALVRGIALGAVTTVCPEGNGARHRLASALADAITGSGLEIGQALEVCSEVLTAVESILWPKHTAVDDNASPG